MQARPKIIPKVKPGDELTVERWNTVVDAVNRAQLIPAQNSGISVQTTPFGTLAWLAGMTTLNAGNGYVGYTATTITSRNGSSLGSGSVYSTTINIANSTVSSISTSSIFVWNAASTSIASNKYCWVEPDVSGNLFVGPLDC